MRQMIISTNLKQLKKTKVDSVLLQEAKFGINGNFDIEATSVKISDHIVTLELKFLIQEGQGKLNLAEELSKLFGG